VVRRKGAEIHGMIFYGHVPHPHRVGGDNIKRLKKDTDVIAEVAPEDAKDVANEMLANLDMVLD
tara:strand:- start:506 stop:697 length:192 start_codon:yes stop_codon:yes gene_type:complete